MVETEIRNSDHLLLTEILGAASDPAIHEALHRLEHAGTVDSLEIEPADLARRRIRMLIASFPRAGRSSASSLKPSIA